MSDLQVGYERPTITVVDEEELLNIFQMTAAEISVAGCWWSPGCGHPAPGGPNP